METIEKNLTTEKSLKIIAETMERSRMTIAKNLGKPLILWGGLVAATSVIITILWAKTGNPAWNLLWFAMSAIGVICNRIIDRKREKAPKSEVSRIIDKIWMWFGIFATGFYALIWIAYFILKSVDFQSSQIAAQSVDLTLVIALMMGLCGVITGVVMKINSVVVCLVIATVISALAALTLGGPAQLLAFVVLAIFGLMIPGFILQNKTRKS